MHETMPKSNITAHLFWVLLCVKGESKNDKDQNHTKKKKKKKSIGKWAGPWENVSYVICEQQRRRSACASAQSDQHLCFRCLDSIISLDSIDEISSL